MRAVVAIVAGLFAASAFASSTSYTVQITHEGRGVSAQIALADDGIARPFQVVQSHDYIAGCTWSSRGHDKEMKTYETGVSGTVSITRKSDGATAMTVHLSDARAGTLTTNPSPCGEVGAPSIAMREALQTIGIPSSGGNYVVGEFRVSVKPTPPNEAH